MAASRPHPKRPPSPPANQVQAQSATLASRSVRGTAAFAGALRQCGDEATMVVESDLSGEMAVRDKELDAIIRLLDGALDNILSGTEGE
jgi:hypothetical protein